MIVDVVFEEGYWYPDQGGEVWIAGYQPVDTDSGRFLGRAAPELTARGIVIAAVAGAARHHGAALAGDAAAPGRALRLRRDPGNPHDPDAVAVHPESSEEAQLGWVPRDLAAELAPQLDAGRPWSAVVLREQRPSPRDPRSGLTMLLAPAPSLELRRVARRPPAF